MKLWKRTTQDQAKGWNSHFTTNRIHNRLSKIFIWLMNIIHESMIMTRFGKGRKGLETPKKRAPSPGTYEHHNTVGDGLKCSIGGGLKFQ